MNTDETSSDSEDASSPYMFSKFMILKVNNVFAGSVKNQLFDVLCQIIEKSMSQLDRALENVEPQSTPETYQVIIDYFERMASITPTIIPNKKVNIEVLYTQKKQNIPSDAENTTFQLQVDEHNNIYLISPFIAKITPYSSKTDEDGINIDFKSMKLEILKTDSSDVLKQLDFVVRKIIDSNTTLWMRPTEEETNTKTVEIYVSEGGETKTKEVKIGVEYTYYPKKGRIYLEKLNGVRNLGGAKQESERDPRYVVEIPQAFDKRKVNTA